MDVSPETLFTAVLLSAVGFGLFQFGRKERRLPQFLAGIALMGYPYFVSSVAWMLAIGAAIVAALWLAVRAGA